MASNNEDRSSRRGNWITNLVTKLIIFTVLLSALLGAGYVYFRQQGIDPLLSTASFVDNLATDVDSNDTDAKTSAALRSFATFLRNTPDDIDEKKAELEKRLKELKGVSASAYEKVKAQLESLSEESGKESDREPDKE